MAFDDLELRRIVNTVGALCRRRSPPQFIDKLQINYEVKGHSALVFETRPPWDRPGEWTSNRQLKAELPVAPDTIGMLWHYLNGRGSVLCRWSSP